MVKIVEMMMFETHFTVGNEPSVLRGPGIWVLKEDRSSSK